MNSCASSAKKEEPETIIKYIVPDVYFPAVPEFETVYVKSLDGVFIFSKDWNIILKYMMETEEAVQALYCYSVDTESPEKKPP